MADTSNDAGRSRVISRIYELINRMSKDEQKALLIGLEKDLYKGRREYERKSFLETLDYTSAAGAYRDFIKNISEGGVFIKTRNPLSVGDEISMTLLDSKQKKRLKMQGEIVRIEREGIGVKFKASQVQREIIKSFVDKV